RADGPAPAWRKRRRGRLARGGSAHLQEQSPLCEVLEQRRGRGGAGDPAQHQRRPGLGANADGARRLGADDLTRRKTTFGAAKKEEYRMSLDSVLQEMQRSVPECVAT